MAFITYLDYLLAAIVIEFCSLIYYILMIIHIRSTNIHACDRNCICNTEKPEHMMGQDNGQNSRSNTRGRN